MKRFAMQILLMFALPAVVLLAAYERVARRAPNEYQAQVDLMEREGPTAELLVLGSSHGQHHFNPDIMGKRGINVGLPGRSVDYDADILSKYIDRLDSLQYVVLPFSLFTPFQTLDKMHERNTTALRYYVTIWHIDHTYPFDIETHFYFPTINPTSALSIAANAIHPAQNQMGTPYAVLPNGFFPLDYTIEGEKLEAVTRGNVKGHSERNKDMMPYLDTIISLCQRHEATLVLITCPARPSYIDQMRRSQIDSVRTIGRQLAMHRNVKYIDLLESPLFEHNDFRDDDHLRDCGAEKLSRMIGDSIAHWDSLKNGL